MAVVALALAAWGGAIAVQGDTTAIELPKCGLELPVSRALLAALPDDRFTGAGDRRSAVLVGDLARSQRGSVVFLRTGGKWRAFAAPAGGAVAGVFRVRRSGAAFVWTVPNADGEQFDGLSMTGAGDDRFCTRVLFPPSSETPGRSFFELTGFNIDARGAGVLIGTAEVTRDVAPVADRSKRKARRKARPAPAPQREQVRLAYRYVSGDGGRRWSSAQLAAPAPTPGLYDRITGAVPALIASLRAQAK